ncbi:MAG TPA: methyltransferase domain-containing protein [Puia sp.]|nr:methyltransferase domain-containing protein [Puia sp.]
MTGGPDFSRRSDEKELLDRDDIPFPDIERNMHELDVINTWLGGHSISIAGLKQLAHGRRRLSICEIGCGGGDNLRVLSRWCTKKGIDVTVTGIDRNPHCIAVAREKWTGGSARWVQSDYRDIGFAAEKPDVIFSSLFCHHFNNEELIFQLRWMDAHAGLGWFINDLHRHPLAYHSIRLLTAGFSGSYLVKHDAPLSVLRGFSRKEWESLLQQAATRPCGLKWKWAFRWLVVARKRYV